MSKRVAHVERQTLLSKYNLLTDTYFVNYTIM